MRCATTSGASVFPFPPEDKTAEAEALPAGDGTQLPPGHPAPAPSQGAASKCPFLAAQMSQQGSSVFRKASLELQEDVQEMHAVRTGNPARPARLSRTLGFIYKLPLGELV